MLISSACAGAALPAKSIPKQLAALAARTKAPSGWGALRRYAISSHDHETQGLAWLTLGYREYAAGKFAPAVEDLRSATATDFTLSDFASYYGAKAAQAGGEPAAGAGTLRDFSECYPQSLLRTKALDLLAELLIESNQSAQAVKLLLAEPALHTSPALLLDLAEAQSQAGNPVDAARSAQEVFYRFPESSQDTKAQAALRSLQRKLGPGFPQPPENLRSSRAALLFRGGRFDAALREYTSLSKQNRETQFAWSWRLVRVRCLFYLKRYEQAAELAGAAMPGHPNEDAERLEILVNIKAHQDNEGGMTAVLNDLGRHYPASPSYGLALSHAGFYYARRGNWKTAAPYYTMAASGFPATPAGGEAAWKTAWYDYLGGAKDKARKAMADYILQYPAASHVPAALYWMGHIALDGSNHVDAQAYFSGLTRRFPQQYYSFLARSLMPPKDVFQAKPPSRPASSQGSQLAVASSVLRAIPSLQGTKLTSCTPMPTSGIIQAYHTLQALSLDDLSEDTLRLAAAAEPDNPWVLLALSRMNYSEGRTTAALFAARHAVPNYQDFEFDALPREIWDYLYPRSYWNLVRRDASANHLDPYLVMAVIRQESAFDPKAISAAGAVGLMQMLPQTVNFRLWGNRRRMVIRSLENPAYNLRLSCHYFRRLLTAFGGNAGEALAAYNAGDVRVRKWIAGNNFHSPQEFIETTPFADTRAYVEEILRDAAIYRHLLAGSIRFAPCDRSVPPAQKKPPARHVPKHLCSRR